MYQKVLVIRASDAFLMTAFITKCPFYGMYNPHKSLIMNSGQTGVFSGNQIAAFQLPSPTAFQWNIWNNGINSIGMVFGNPETSYVVLFAADMGSI